ncbi:hypothetical protein EJ04DRAFT_522385 [Polyplosphaeria fusca]|uniref:Kelch repeat protein n=1 Tax=Polyplosphaeria fusca TaxID=682080 RepID=A0A9P4QYF5_9PLEO|nr:hypothetical protein EJ04DRAFT_522385 [Polyplosphaeria fusca]
MPVTGANHYLRIVDFTSERDLSDSSILTAHDIPSNITIFFDGTFWVDSGTAYVIGGWVDTNPWISRDGSILPNNATVFRGDTVFKYEIDQDNWTIDTADHSDNSSVTNSFCCGSFAYNAGNKRAYFYAGTTATGPTDQWAFGNKDLLTFDTPSFRWTNVSTNEQVTPEVNIIGGSFVFLPGTESTTGGIGVLIGGVDLNKESNEPLRSVLVYDSATDSWYRQSTTAEGDFPSSRWHFCAVAASASDNSSHSIYVYGGEALVRGQNASSEIWILSVPSFHWLLVDVDSEPRKHAGCTTVAERYMLTYGGQVGGYYSDESLVPCDQENYGLRLFDLSTLAWTTHYGGPASDTQKYSVPKLVYDVIGGNEQGGATQTAPSDGFNTPGLQSLFQAAPGAMSTSTSTTSPSTSSKSNTGAIAGGVVGGVAGVALIVGAVIYLLRRKNKLRALNAGETKTDDVAKYASGATGVFEVEAQPIRPKELAGDSQWHASNKQQISEKRGNGMADTYSHFASTEIGSVSPGER